jgi:hypothetical protein
VNVDDYFPHDPRITDEQRSRLGMPEKLRGISDRTMAQVIFDGWIAANPKTKLRLVNPPHWQGTD